MNYIKRFEELNLTTSSDDIKGDGIDNIIKHNLNKLLTILSKPEDISKFKGHFSFKFKGDNNIIRSVHNVDDLIYAIDEGDLTYIGIHYTFSDEGISKYYCDSTLISKSRKIIERLIDSFLRNNDYRINYIFDILSENNIYKRDIKVFQLPTVNSCYFMIDINEKLFLDIVNLVKTKSKK